MASTLKYKWGFGGSLNIMYPYGAKEWNVNWINKTGGEKKKLQPQKRRVMDFDNNLSPVEP